MIILPLCDNCHSFRYDIFRNRHILHQISYILINNDHKTNQLVNVDRFKGMVGMQMDNSMLKRMPFPYFIINRNFEILYTSDSARQYFSSGKLFTHFIAQDDRAFFDRFLSQQHNVCEMKMVVNKQKPEVFQIYKQILTDREIHLFCIPKEPYICEVHELLDQVENKIIDIQDEIKANKQHMAKTVQDIQEAAIQSEQLATIGQLAAGVAHEIRNPLTTIKGFIQLIKPYLAEVGKEQYAIIALDEINRANEIIHEFLNAAKPQKNKKQVININKLLKDIKILYESEAILRNIEIDFIPADESCLLFIDIKQIKQVLVNIIKNSMEAIEEIGRLDKGIIRIETRKVDKNAIIIISDNGIGMKQETIDKLFTPFFSTKEAGTGIGMTVCKKIIEEHFGIIKVESEHHKGTTFRIELPIYQEALAKINS